MIALFTWYLHRKVGLTVGQAFMWGIPAGMIGDMLIAIALAGLLR